MRYRSTYARRGVTLTEVLVAIFIMGIGLLSLLVLFPLGALQMAQAIRDDRCTHAKLNAFALANTTIPYTNSTSYTLKDDPYSVATNYVTNPAVYVDPIGVKVTAGYTLGTVPTGAAPFVVNVYQPKTTSNLGASIPRVCPSFINLTGTSPFYDLDHWCVMTDDIQFDVNGAPLIPIQRENRYSWAWLCRQTQPYASATSQTPTPLAVLTTVVVYDRRPLTTVSQTYQAAGGPSVTYTLPAGETICTGAFTGPVITTSGITPGLNTASLSWKSSSVAPNLKAGTWVLDAVNYYFYRIVGTPQPLSNPPPGTAGVTIELHMNARATNKGGTAVVMEGVAEVYEKGPIVPQ